MLNVENCPQLKLWDDGDHYSFLSLSLAPAVGEMQEEGDKLQTFATPKLAKFDSQWRIIHGAIATNRHIAHIPGS